MPGSDDERAVEQLPACGAHPALRERVGSGRPHWRAQHLDRLGREHRVERGGESAVPVAEGPACVSTPGIHPQPMVRATTADLTDDERPPMHRRAGRVRATRGS